MIYKVSSVVIGGQHPGAILNQDHLPEPGEIVTLGKDQFEVVEVTDLVPPRGEFAYIHATVQSILSDESS